MLKQNVTVSKGNPKLKGIRNVSFTPIKSCGQNCKFCFQNLIDKKGKKIKLECYAVKAYTQYDVVRIAWDSNLEIYKKNPFKFHEDIVKDLLKYTGRYYRIHVAGDFFDQKNVDLWVNIANSFPKKKFLAFTKRFDLNYTKKPVNLAIYFSIMPKMEIPFESIYENKAMQAFCDLPENFKKVIAKKCPGNCSKCHMCWNANHNVFFAVH
jgi:hypothetical protein